MKVTDVPEDTDYNLRLCRKRSVICAGEGPHRTVRGASTLPVPGRLFQWYFTLVFWMVFQIKSEHLQRSITLQYSKALPCLCIEVWKLYLIMSEIWLFENSVDFHCVFLSGLACQSRCTESSSVSIQKQWVKFTIVLNVFNLHHKNVLWGNLKLRSKWQHLN